MPIYDDDGIAGIVTMIASCDKSFIVSGLASCNLSISPAFLLQEALA